MSVCSGWREGSAPIRLMLLFDATGWGLVLSRPGDQFATSHSYNLMAGWASEDSWTVLFFLAGFALALCAVIQNRFVRAGLVAYTCALQAAIAVSFGAAPSIGTEFGTHLGVALAGSWLIWRELDPT